MIMMRKTRRQELKDAKKKEKKEKEKKANKLKALRNDNRDKPWGKEDWTIQDEAYSND